MANFVCITIVMRYSNELKRQVHRLEARVMAQNAAVASSRAIAMSMHQRERRGAVFPAAYALLWRPPDWRRFSCPNQVRHEILALPINSENGLQFLPPVFCLFIIFRNQSCYDDNVLYIVYASACCLRLAPRSRRPSCPTRRSSPSRRSGS